MTNASENGYNGMTNYETWVIDLDYDSTEAGQAQAKEMAQAAFENAVEDLPYFTQSIRAQLDLADAIKEELMERVPEELWATVFGSLINAAFSEANFMEIAEGWLTGHDIEGYVSKES